MEKVWLITGTSSGFGRQLVEQLLPTGDRIVATARRLETIADYAEKGMDRVLLAELDVTDAAQAKRVAEEAVKVFGRIDVVVNNAGYDLTGAFEGMTDQQIRDQFETNVFGVINVIRATLPIFKTQGAGHYINFSSVLGKVSFPLQSIYSATKYAIEGLSDSLSQELAGFGIKTTVVEPAVYKTEINRKSPRVAGLPEYKSIYEAVSKQFASFPHGDPALAVKAILELTAMENPPLHFPLGAPAYATIRADLQARLDELGSVEKLSAFPVVS
ncbi:SDR family NAD(P)-dependent oxidoreductase [Gorillibacterium timonense]|uniref:SDR family NAD(P)-dependent oxidoreductase n=1 Tax=Gorillibacterium timonense TaxID=1689269 RepID=UPI00071D94BD|nr:SDR family NAD(P)-dependent oxidoreductase [Gorillibacterium timonense]